MTDRNVDSNGPGSANGFIGMVVSANAGSDPGMRYTPSGHMWQRPHFIGKTRVQKVD
ncbi:MAG TPA: hypothetical protein VE136_03035 [Anaerolineales bacterium]|jgi:hypothetical protein|nr:hypothetical protein [Anaerolineales bacterium]